MKKLDVLSFQISVTILNKKNKNKKNNFAKIHFLYTKLLMHIKYYFNK